MRQPRSHIKMPKKDLVRPEKHQGVQTSQEAREATGIIEGFDFWTSLGPFIITRKTKSDVSVKLAPSCVKKTALNLTQSSVC